jgi:hypothetical protein
MAEEIAQAAKLTDRRRSLVQKCLENGESEKHISNEPMLRKAWRERPVGLHEHQPHVSARAVRGLFQHRACSFGENGFPVLLACPRLERVPSDLRKIAPERSAIEGIADALEPLVHLDAVFSHVPTNHVHRHLKV